MITLFYLLAKGGQASVSLQLVHSNNIQTLYLFQSIYSQQCLHILQILFDAGVCNVLAGGRQGAGRADCERRETAREPFRVWYHIVL